MALHCHNIRNTPLLLKILKAFNSFRVKLVMSSENQSLSPVFRNLRVTQQHNGSYTIKDEDEIFRDEESTAIVNTNREEYLQYVTQRDKMRSEKQRITDLEKQVDGIKSDIGDIKNLLQIIANK